MTRLSSYRLQTILLCLIGLLVLKVVLVVVLSYRDYWPPNSTPRGFIRRWRGMSWLGPLVGLEFVRRFLYNANPIARNSRLKGEDKLAQGNALGSAKFKK